MKIDSLKQLKAIVRLCQESGVSSIEIDNVKMIISPKAQQPQAPDLSAFMPPEAAVRISYNGPIAEPEEPKVEGLTEEQLMNWSVTDQPGEVQ